MDKQNVHYIHWYKTGINDGKQDEHPWIPAAGWQNSELQKPYAIGFKEGKLLKLLEKKINV